MLQITEDEILSPEGKELAMLHRNTIEAARYNDRLRKSLQNPGRARMGVLAENAFMSLAKFHPNERYAGTLMNNRIVDSIHEKYPYEPLDWIPVSTIDGL